MTVGSMISASQITGQYSDGKTSRCTETRLYLTDEGFISLEGIDKEPVAFTSVNVSPRIGDTPRYVEFPDGAHFETPDNEGIDRIIKQASNRRWHNLVHTLESSKRWVFATLLVVILFGWSFIQFGIPYFSKEIAFMIPDEHSRLLGAGVLDSLDEHLMQASELSEARQQDLQQEFVVLLNTLGLDNIRVVFRKSDAIGANALALPDGTVVFTDGLINLAADNNEIISVMLHEIGHLHYRHSLRRVIQGFSLALFVAVIAGDVASSSTIITGLPVLLVESGYSRDMETEADTFALQYMLRHAIDPAYFSIMMQKLQVSHTSGFKQCAKRNADIQECLRKTIEAARADQSTQQEKNNIRHYFASHPLTKERMARFENAEKSNGSAQPLPSESP
ncbi:MAG: M48 family metallopeptidase [Gammaproteobacteria bacterium]|nr:M48 family metallopeptidase [Gammaproteobacteria bacterium]